MCKLYQYVHSVNEPQLKTTMETNFLKDLTGQLAMENLPTNVYQ